MERERPEKQVFGTLTEYLYTKASRCRIPFSGTFELSPLCNFSCRMCYVRKTAGEVAGHSRPLMTLEQWLEHAEEAQKSGMLYLLLTGGEPFLWPNFWKLYEALIHMGFLVDINTNGSLIDREVVARLRQLPPHRINLTLYGACEETYEKLCCVKGAFSKVEKAITMLQETGIPLKLNASLTPHNVSDLKRLVTYAEEKGLVLQASTYMFPPVRRDKDQIGKNDRFTPWEAAKYRLECFRLQYGNERYRSFLNSIKSGYIPPPGLDESCVDPLDGKVRCRAGKASFWITWDGFMTPCGLMNQPAMDLRKTSFSEAWNQLVAESDKLVLSGLCSQCTSQKICHPCAAMAMAETGTTEGIPFYLCEMIQAMKEIADLEA